MRWFHVNKKKPQAAGVSTKGQFVDTQSSGNLNIQASAITMSEEDRMALMIMVKQGDITLEEALEQWKE